MPMQNFERNGDFLSEDRAAMTTEFPKYIEDVVLAANTLVRVPIPTDAKFAVFSFDGNFRCRLGIATTNLALPVATTADGSGSELNPTTRRVTRHLADGTTVPTHICLRAAAACSGSIAFFGSVV